MNLAGEDYRGTGFRAALIVLGLCAATYAAILFLNDGYFTFSLDDPYIHLAMAEEILRGNYGINTGEYAAAASSIIYPFLLLPFVALGLGAYGELLINVAASAACGVLGVMLLAEARLPLNRVPLLPVAMAAVAIGSGLVAIAFTGLEHTLQVASALVCLLGLIRFLDRARVEPWWALALISAPLFRYENAALLAAAIVILLIRREWKWAALIGIAGFGLVAAFGLFLISLGLPPLPASVLVKSSGAASGVDHGLMGIVSATMRNLGANMQDARSGFMLIGLVLFGYGVAREAHFRPRFSDWSKEALVALFCLLVILAQLAFGIFAWFERYHVYLLCVMLFGAAYIHRDWLRPFLARPTRWGVVVFSILFVLFFMRYTANLSATVKSANNIYEQQYQMHRFVTEFYRAPVAVHDLGWVSYRNPNYILDLEGLGSNIARRARVEHPDSAEWMQQMAEQHGVKLAMVFRGWFPHLPCEWVPVGDLILSRKNISVPLDRVTFFAVPPGDPAELRGKIENWVKTLPKAVRFDFADKAENSCRS